MAPGSEAAVAFGSKADTLARVGPLLRGAEVLPFRHFTVRRWRDDRPGVLAELSALPWAAERCIVRSSALIEDAQDQSMAGHFLSVADVTLARGLGDAVDRVVESYGPGCSDADQVLVQRQLVDVAISGVAFTRDPASRAHYFIIEYETRGDTAAVTGGRASELHSFVHWKQAPLPADRRMAAVIELLRELEALLGHDSLDIEFAIGGDGRVFLFQVRPLVLPPGDEGVGIEAHRELLTLIADRIAIGTRPDPFIHGQRTVYGVMPDWNPAEIIGIRPRPLALSLYRDLVTDAVWAYQRNNYGYKNLRSCPLLVHFHGLPYIDVRVSFNSFVPGDIDGELADRLVNYYIDALLAAPHLHDKVEFEILFSCYTPMLPQKIAVLGEHGFREQDRLALTESLKKLTNDIIHPQVGLWRTDLRKLDTLEERHRTLLASGADTVSLVYWLIEDCKRYGSLPFAGLARAGFIAVQLLQSLVEIGVLTAEEYGRFLANLNTVSSQIVRDRARIDRTTFLSRYGHLRPGTYDILSPRYDEAPDLYFDWSIPEADPADEDAPFTLSLSQMRDVSTLLREHGLESDIVTFFEFVKAAIEGREYAKFVFTRNLSDALSLLRNFGEKHGFSAEDMSFADISVIRELYLSGSDPRQLLRTAIAQGRERYEISKQIRLPPLIRSTEDVWTYEMPRSEPNFVTLKSAVGPVVDHHDKSRLAGAIVLIPNADPGFDWLFSHPIAGLATAYGGANSHMAIRAGELGIPAVIGAGEVLYGRWAKAAILSLDCANRTATVIR